MACVWLISEETNFKNIHLLESKLVEEPNKLDFVVKLRVIP